MDFGLREKVAVVTASSRGLGKAAALEIAREGANVVICARGEEIFRTANEIRNSTSAEVLALKTDITDPIQVDKLIQAANKRFGKIDILISNAGGPPPGEFLDLKPNDWEDAIQLTLMSVVNLCHRVIPHMIKAGHGSIVAIQSYSIRQPVDGLILSNSLRLAVVQLMESLAQEFGPKGIRVNSINPYFTKTNRVEQFLLDRASKRGTTMEQEATRITQDVPLRRMGTIEEFGKTIAFLASPAASHINGHALMFDGGAVKSPL